MISAKSLFTVLLGVCASSTAMMEGIDRYHWNLARTFFSLSAVSAVVGIISNFLIVLATVKTRVAREPVQRRDGFVNFELNKQYIRSMRSTCNMLIALCAIGDIFHQCGTLIQLPLLFDIHLEIDHDLCIAIMFPAEMGIAIGSSCILCIGLDRMISVTFPTRYQTLNRRYYYLLFACVILVYCGYLIFLMILFRQDRLVVCEVVSPYSGEGVVYFNYFNVAVNFTSVLVYSITWRGLKKQADASMMKRIVKSLFIIVAVDVSGWTMTPGTIIFLHTLDLSAQQLFAWTYLCTIFINISLSIKLFIYYYTSSDYRAALRGLLPFWARKKSSVKSTTVTVTIH